MLREGGHVNDRWDDLLGGRLGFVAPATLGHSMTDIGSINVFLLSRAITTFIEFPSRLRRLERAGSLVPRSALRAEVCYIPSHPAVGRQGAGVD